MTEDAIGIAAAILVGKITVVPGAEGGPAFIASPQNIMIQWQNLRAQIKAVAGAPKTS